MTTAAPGLDRRLAPRPLPLHLASASLLWLSSRAALTSLANGWPLSKRPGNLSGDGLAALVGDVARLGREAVAEALDRELRHRADAFLTGLETYRGHPYRRPARRVPVM